MCYPCLAPYIIHKDLVKFKPPHVDKTGIIKVKVKKLGLGCENLRIRFKTYSITDHPIKEFLTWAEGLDAEVEIKVRKFVDDTH